ncbi:MAG: aspartyl/asparaginyl beta-hydroxylase domain-containing protein [Alphaproteobacteria bacterium]|nr:aspartyl/asparaginyl beta-hydroxylase domain-containing protein [Alphaproteobacteria bacterium]
MPHFTRIGALAIDALAGAVDTHAARFADMVFRQRAPGSAHPDTETIYLRMPPTLSRETIFESLDSIDYPLMQEPAIREAVAAVSRLAGGRAARAMIVKLKPGGRIAPHVDEGAYAAATRRYHLPIATNPLAWLEAGGERLHLPAGTLWWFDKHALHRGGNDGATDRIHLIVDTLPL